MAKFVMVEKHLYWWPVTVRIPNPDAPGEFIEQSFEMQFEAQTRDQALERQEVYEALTTERARIEHDKDGLRKTCRSWRGIVDVNGQDVPFSPARFDECIGLSWFRIGVMNAISQSAWGLEAQAGN